MDPNTQKPLVAMAGASGFVGGFVRKELSDVYSFRALTRSEALIERGDAPEGTEWVQSDLYSLPKLTELLKGCRFAIYLVHSMNPSSRLVQANFADLDLLLADNFIRACETAGVEHVVYLGGLMPSDKDEVSQHLASRKEVESVLRSRSVKVSVLRAGLIFGPGGSSCTMLLQLVRRLPIMLLPAWTSSMTQSIDVVDVTRAFRGILEDADLAGGTFDMGGHPAMSYREMIQKTGQCLGTKNRYFGVPLNAFSLSLHWISWFSGVSASLVGPLLESLRHDLRAGKNALMDELHREGVISFEESIQKATDESGKPLPNPRSIHLKEDRTKIRQERLVRSVQRLSLPEGWNAEKVADEYGKWLTRCFGGMLHVKADEEGIIYFRWRWPRLLLLRLRPTPYTVDSKRRKAYYIDGGCLCDKRHTTGRFEFRSFPKMKVCIASIHNFRPGLPWWLYSLTQAKVHLWVMRAFGKFLYRQGLRAR